MKRLQNTFKAQNKGTLYTHTHLISEKQNQTGRSMVEMLGVLAVIGVLSVAGMAGYTSAVNKNRANTIINEAQKRATLVVPQIQMMGNTEPSLSEFDPYNAITGGTFSGTVYTKNNSSIADGQFAIMVSGVQKAVCQNILNTIGDNTIIRRLSTESAQTTALTTCADDNTLLFVYNNDMSAKALPTDFDNNTSCTDAGFVWNNGQCANDLCDTCPSSQTCLTIAEEKKCISPCPSGVDRNDDGTCADNKCTDYTNCEGDYFCNFDSYSTSGTCKLISSIDVIHSEDITINEKSYTGIESRIGQLKSYYQAEDWCLAQGGMLPKAEWVGETAALSYHQCPTTGGDIVKELFKVITQRRWLWAEHPSNNQNNSFSFLLIDSSGDCMCTYENDNKTDRTGLCLLPK